MTIRALYADFFYFLEQSPEEGMWEAYQRFYLNPHRDFFHAHWASFGHMDLTQIAQRVENIKREDYGHLQSLILAEDPAVLAEEALRRARALLPIDPEPDVYLFVGFFSADGKVLEIQKKPAIAMGLERFKDFRDLSLLIAHEYGHCAQKALLKDLFPGEMRPLHAHLTAEGLAVLFTEALYPEIPLHRHLFISRERLRWCEENREILFELGGADLATEKLVPVFFGTGDAEAGIPPRIGYYLARQMVLGYLSRSGAKDLGEVFPGFEKILRQIQEKGF